jgi:hypothetical protein
MPMIINTDGDLEFRQNGEPLVSWGNPGFSKEHLAWVSSMMDIAYAQGQYAGIQKNQADICKALGITEIPTK